MNKRRNCIIDITTDLDGWLCWLHDETKANTMRTNNSSKRHNNNLSLSRRIRNNGSKIRRSIYSEWNIIRFSLVCHLLLIAFALLSHHFYDSFLSWVGIRGSEREVLLLLYVDFPPFQALLCFWSSLLVYNSDFAIKAKFNSWKNIIIKGVSE